MEFLKEKIITHAVDGKYFDHAQGDALIEIDLQDFENMISEKLNAKLCECYTRMEYLELRERDLLDENNMLRAKLIGNDNKTNTK